MNTSRYIPHTNEPPSSSELEVVAATIQDALVNNVKRVHRHPSSKPRVYTGDAGALLMDWRVSSAFLSLKLPTISAYTLNSIPFYTPHSGSHASFLETSVGPATLVLVHELRALAASNGSAKRNVGKTWEAAARLLNDTLNVVANEELDEEGCEVLYGRAGILYALLLLREELNRVDRAPSDELQKDPVAKAVARICAEQNLRTLVADIIARGQVGARAYVKEYGEAGAPPLMWSWHNKRYLGGAHGVAGILQMLISCPSSVVRDHWSAVVGSLEWLVSAQEPSGNWPSKAGHGSKASWRPSGGQEVNELLQWCHGAPGVVILLSTVVRRCAQSRHLPLTDEFQNALLDALKRGGALVYERGLLRKGVGLCHGVAGSVYALLAVSDILERPAQDGKEWLMRAAHLALLAASYRALEEKGEMRTPDRPYSLYEGVAGMCCAWAEVLARLTKQHGEFEPHGMPGYDDLVPTTMPPW